VRAIEQGLPLVRAANTGISAVLDPLGRTVASLPLGTEGVFDASLPRAIDATIYVRVGDGFVIVLMIAAIALIVRRRVHYNRRLSVMPIKRFTAR
jgi:apolipoprotein N-acyltransferase